MKSKEKSMTLHYDAPINYYNSVGLIYDDYIYINKKECLVRLESNLIRNVYFKKEKELKYNYLLLTIGLLLFTTILLSEKHMLFEFKFIGYSVALFFSLFSLIKNFDNYKIIITTINCNIITTKIDSDNKDDALELVTRLKQIINPKTALLRAI